MSDLQIIEGDITEVVTSGIIAHVVNNRNAMGAGVARALFQKWPAVKTQYHRWMDICDLKPGEFSCVNFVEVTSDITVANMVAQDDFGPGDRCYIDYDQFRSSMLQVAEFAGLLDLQVYLPYGVGAGLAGGDWDTIVGIIKETCPDAILVRLP